MTKQKIVIDTDPGVDDAAAILMALASPEIEVLGISVVAGNVALKDSLINACKIVGLSGRRGVPVYAGAAGPLVRAQVYGKYAGIGAFSDDLVAAADIVPDREHAVHFLVRTAREAAAQGDPITICAIGPLTNIALALRAHPDVARGIRRIVAMGGAFTVPGHRTPWAEFNVYADPHAADIVYRSGVPLVVMPLDMTFKALFGEKQIHFMKEHGGRPGTALFNLLTTFDRSDEKRFGRPGGPIHDATTIAWLIEPGLFSMRDAAIGVALCGVTMGHTYADFYGKSNTAPNAAIAMDVDEPGYIRLLLERLARYGQKADAATPIVEISS